MKYYPVISKITIFYYFTRNMRPPGPRETRKVNPEIKQLPEIILVIQFRHLGGNLQIKPNIGIVLEHVENLD